MALDPNKFIGCQAKSVDKNLPGGGWQVYSSYTPWEYEEEHEEEVQRFAFIQATPIRWIERPVPEDNLAYEAGYKRGFAPDWTDVEVYAPLGVDDLFVQFAQLFGDGPVDPFAQE